MTRPVLYINLFIFLNGAIFSQWTHVGQVNNIGEYPVISMADCNTVVVAGNPPGSTVVYRSTNGGLNFANITTPEITRDLYSVWAMNKDTIFAGDGGSQGGLGGDARIYRTISGGVNWTVVLTTGGNSGFISGIVFERPAQNFGIVVSDPPMAIDSFWIAKTTDRGSSWAVTRAPKTSQYTVQKSVFLVDNMFYGFGLSTAPARISITTNGGISWNSRPVSLSGVAVTSAAFNSDKLNGIALSDISLPNVAITSNGGLNWVTYSSGAGSTGVGTVKWVPGTNIYYLCASRIKRTSNGGFNWEEMNTGGVANFSHMDLILAGVNNICAYALASDGKVLKYEGEPFGIQPISSEIPRSFELLQNYPNPFNPVTFIRFQITTGNFTSLKVFDSRGKEIRTLVDEQLRAGKYEIEWSASDYPSGIYYCLLVSGNNSSTKKMVLVK